MAISDAILHKQPPELTDKNLPARLKGIIRRLLEKERQRRYETAGELLTELKDLEASLAPGRFRLSPRAKVAAAAALVILIAAGAFLWRRESRERWALQKAMPEITRRIQDGQFLQAVELLKEARAILPNDPTLEKLWTKATGEITIVTEPAGADVSFRPYSSTGPWQFVGKTPLDRFRTAWGGVVWRVHKDGFADSILLDGPEMSWSIKLRRAEALPPEMVPVAATEASLGTPFIESPHVQLDDFLIDRTR